MSKNQKSRQGPFYTSWDVSWQQGKYGYAREYPTTKFLGLYISTSVKMVQVVQ